MMDASLQRTDNLFSFHLSILEMIASGAPLSETLDMLEQLVTAQAGVASCRVLLVSEDGKTLLRDGVASLGGDQQVATSGPAVAPPYASPCCEAVHCAQTIAVPDIAASEGWSPAWRNRMQSQGFASTISVPVRGSDGRVLASLALFSNSVGTPEPDRAELLDIVVHLAAIAIERHHEIELHARSEEDLRKSKALLAAELLAAQQLQSTSTLLIQEGDPQALYEHIIDAAIALMSADAASMQMLHRSRGELRLIAWKGFHPQSAVHWRWISHGSAISCGEAFKTVSRIIVADIEEDDTIAPAHLSEFRRSGIRAMQSTPLISRSGNLLGMISTHWREPKTLTDADFGPLDVLARQAADLIERTQSEMALRKRERDQSALYRLTDTLYRAEQLGQVYEAAFDAICTTLTCTRASILLFDESGEMQFAAWRGLSEEYREAVAGHSPWQPHDRDPDPIFIENIENFEKEEIDDAVRGAIKKEGITALAFIPLVDNGKVIGKFMTYYERPHFFSKEEADLAMNIAHQLGFSIERKRAEMERRAAERRQKLLINELNHRVKNTLATIQSLATQTLRGAGVAQEIRASLDSRLAALARSHDILTQEQWERARLREVVERSLEPFAADKAATARFIIEGDDVLLSPKTALSLGMALHELATNAAKYGALSMPAGKVIIRWTVEPTGTKKVVRLVWHERDGPTVVTPKRRGFGTRLIERALAYDLRGKVKLDFAPDGLRLEFLLSPQGVP
jgi:two-component sensor histidine kinase